MRPAIIQARMSSTRLPGKVLRSLGNDTVLGHVARQVRSFGGTPIVCTSDLPSDDPIQAFCTVRGLPCIRGPLEDVLERFVMSLRDPSVGDAEWFYRVTADCPLLSPTLCNDLWEAKSDDLDFLGIDQNLVPSGVSAELIRRSSFETMASDPKLDRQEREHVTLAMYRRPESYQCARLSPPPQLAHPEYRLTLDYPQDFEVLDTLFREHAWLTASEAIANLMENDKITDSLERQRVAAGA